MQKVSSGGDTTFSGQGQPGHHKTRRNLRQAASPGSETPETLEETAGLSSATRATQADSSISSPDNSSIDYSGRGAGTDGEGNSSSSSSGSDKTKGVGPPEHDSSVYYAPIGGANCTTAGGLGSTSDQDGVGDGDGGDEGRGSGKHDSGGYKPMCGVDVNVSPGGDEKYR